MSIMIVLGGGGHTFEMIKITEELDLKDAVYVVNHDDHYSPLKIKNRRVHRVIRPRKPAEYSFMALLRFILSFLNSLLLILKLRPKVIVTNGPSISVPIGIVGKMLRIQLVYVESICRVYRLSLSGRVLLPLADLFIAQWPYLKKYSNKIVYAGRIF